MRLISLIFMLAVILTACTSTSTNPHLATDMENAPNPADQLIDNHFKELDIILASDIESRDLLQAKNLILELKNTLPADHARKKELAIAERWITESVDCKTNIKLLNFQTRMLKTQNAKLKEALKQVRQMLVSE